jgi:hypothetical protein
MFSGERTLVFRNRGFVRFHSEQSREILRRNYEKTNNLSLTAILLLTMSIFSAANVFAQSDEVLVAGDPAFAQSDFDEIVKYYERGLDIKFSDEERGEFQSKDNGDVAQKSKVEPEESRRLYEKRRKVQHGCRLQN